MQDDPQPVDQDETEPREVVDLVDITDEEVATELDPTRGEYQG